MLVCCVKKVIIPKDILYLAHNLDDFKGGMAANPPLFKCGRLCHNIHD